MNYFCGLLLPSQLRVPFFVTRAFNIDIASIQDQVKENDSLGQMRFRFWRDVLDELFLEVEHKQQQADAGRRSSRKTLPTGEALRDLLGNEKTRFNRKWLDKLVDSREMLLLNQSVNQSFKHLKELRLYSVESVSPLFHMLYEVSVASDPGSSIGQQPKPKEVTEVFNRAAEFIGIATTLYAFPHLVSKGQPSNFPEALLRERDVSADDIFSYAHQRYSQQTTKKNQHTPAQPSELTFTPSSRRQRMDERYEQFRSCVAEVTEAADSSLTAARSLFSTLDKKTQQRVSLILLPITPAEQYLKQLKGQNYDLIHPTLTTSSGFTEAKICFTLLQKKLRGTI